LGSSQLVFYEVVVVVVVEEEEEEEEVEREEGSEETVVVAGFARSSMISFSKDMGLVGGPYLFTGIPSLSHKNFVKFHLIREPKVPVSLALRNLKIG